VRGHSRSSQREKVKQARAIADAALGDATHRDYRSEPTIKAVPRDESHLVHPADESIQVLTVREAAIRVGLSSNELERMVATGAVRSLTAGWTTVIPLSEVERLIAR
jgi:hypothetical protein